MTLDAGETISPKLVRRTPRYFKKEHRPCGGHPEKKKHAQQEEEGGSGAHYKGGLITTS